MPIITLTTDWQSDDFYVGTIKGHIYSNCPNATIVDITHKVEGFKSAHSAFILRGTYPHFPAGTIHLLCTNSEVTPSNFPMCFLHKGQYFIGADSRAFKILFGERPEKAIALSNDNGLTLSTFPELTIFAQTACLLANGMPLENLGIDITDDYNVLTLLPSTSQDSISGSVVYIDSYKNVITDISKELFRSVGNKRKYEITIKNEMYKIEHISNNYSDVKAGELLAIFNSLGLLEIAMRNAHFAEHANIDVNSSVLIKFK